MMYIENLKGSEKMNQIADTELCDNCGRNSLFFDSENGEAVCTYCGEVKKTNTIRRAFTFLEHAERSGTEIFNREGGTQIGNHGDIGGSQNPLLIKRLRKQQSKITLSSNESRNLKEAFEKIRSIKDKLHLSNNVSELAKTIYRMALENNLIKGRKIIDMTYASVYYACRIMDIPRTMKEFIAIGEINKASLASYYRFLLRELSKKLQEKHGIKAAVQDFRKYINPLAKKLKLPEPTYRLVIEITRVSQQQRITAGKNPMSIVVASIYIATILFGDKISQREIEEKTKVAKVTIKNRYKEIVKKLLFVVHL